MSDAQEAPVAGIGDNNPPPFTRHEMHIDELYQEAKLWLDGEPISTQAQADDVTNLLNMIRDARKEADKQRAEEKAPYLEAGRQVDASYKPMLDKADRATQTAKNALTPWLQAVKAENDRIAREKAAAAEEARLAAIREHELARTSETLTDRDALDAADRLAKGALKEAKDATKVKASAGGSVGRAVRLRTVWYGRIDDRRAVLNHFLTNRPDFIEKLEALLQQQVNADIRGGARSIPGVEIYSEEEAV